MFPVVEPSPLHLAFLERKAKWFNEVQNSARGQAGPACVSGVPVNFGMHEYDVRCQFGAPPVFLLWSWNGEKESEKKCQRESLLVWCRA